MSSKEHWENVYTTKSTTSVSWFQEHASKSLQLIQSAATNTEASIIDVGGGASTLVDDLLTTGFSDVSVLDISGAALNVAIQRLGHKSSNVNWIEGDITKISLPAQRYDIWHDRAVFHFLTEAQDRKMYVSQLINSLKPEGQLIISTFADNGPRQCSNLPVVRYSPESLQQELGDTFEVLESIFETHVTPFDTHQAFIYCRFKKCVG